MQDSPLAAHCSRAGAATRSAARSRHPPRTDEAEHGGGGVHGQARLALQLALGKRLARLHGAGVVLELEELVLRGRQEEREQGGVGAGMGGRGKVGQQQAAADTTPLKVCLRSPAEGTQGSGARPAAAQGGAAAPEGRRCVCLTRAGLHSSTSMPFTMPSTPLVCTGRGSRGGQRKLGAQSSGLGGSLLACCAGAAAGRPCATQPELRHAAKPAVQACSS